MTVQASDVRATSLPDRTCGTAIEAAVSRAYRNRPTRDRGIARGAMQDTSAKDTT